jgi:hypothetical protein
LRDSHWVGGGMAFVLGFAGSELCVEQSWTEYGEKLKKVDFLRAMDRLNKMEGD